MGLYDEYEKTFQLFPENLQNSEKGKALKIALEKFKQSKVGSVAPLFSVKDMDGKIVNLAQFKNQNFVLIDFWASWCKPCREENPHLISIYNEFKDKGLEIISISRDENLQSWQKVISQDEMNWLNISIVENESNIEKEYFVQGIPHKVLIGKNGKIIGKWKGSGMKNIYSLREKLAEVTTE